MSILMKRSLEEPLAGLASLSNSSAVILDIEGTITPISFVKDTLFGYVRKNLENFVSENWTNEEFKSVREELIAQASTDVDENIAGSKLLEQVEDDDIARKDLVSNVLWQMDADRKTGGLKKLQGLIYKKGYEKEELHAELFPDVAPALKNWKAANKSVYIYSSGSVDAQKLLVQHTAANGNLLEIFNGFFDTTVGQKTESSSYLAIAEKIQTEPKDILFLTDSVKEAASAKEAGLMVLIVEREGNMPLTDNDRTSFSVITNLPLCMEVEEIQAKRQKVETTEEAQQDDKTSTEEKPKETQQNTTCEEEKPKEIQEEDISKDEKPKEKQQNEMSTEEKLKETQLIETAPCEDTPKETQQEDTISREDKLKEVQQDDATPHGKKNKEAQQDLMDVGPTEADLDTAQKAEDQAEVIKNGTNHDDDEAKMEENDTVLNGTNGVKDTEQTKVTNGVEVKMEETKVSPAKKVSLITEKMEETEVSPAKKLSAEDINVPSAECN